MSVIPVIEAFFIIAFLSRWFTGAFSAYMLKHTVDMYIRMYKANPKIFILDLILLVGFICSIVDMVIR